MPKPPGKNLYVWIPTIGLIDAIAKHDTRGRQETLYLLAAKAAEARNLDLGMIEREAIEQFEADNNPDPTEGRDWENAHRE